MNRALTMQQAGVLAAAVALAGGNAFAQTSVTYTQNADFDIGTLTSVNHDVAGQLQLSQQSQSDPFAYVAMPSEGVLLKIDTSSGKQVARYPTVYIAGCPNCPKANNPCDFNGYCGDWDPSRTAVDTDGNVWVANRSFGGGDGGEPNRGQGSVTKIGNLTAGTCIDRNGNGKIDTSHDANLDGVIAENDPNEYLGQGDECLIKSIAVGPKFAILRALAIDNDGTLWVGGFNNGHAYHIDPVSGAQIGDEFLGTTPYGFAIRGDYLYSAGLGNYAARLNKVTHAVKRLNATCNYGMTIDQGGIMWTGSYCGGVSRCDFDGTADLGSCDNFGGDGHNGISVDPAGDIWAAGSGRVQKYSGGGALLGSVNVPGDPYGIAVASDGRIFSAGNTAIATVDRGAALGAPGSVHLTGPIDAPGVTYLWGYTYSDMTGFIARNIQFQLGKWDLLQDSSASDTLWTKLTWNQEPAGFTGPGATLTVQIRAANSAGDLGAQPFTTVASGTDLSGLGIKGRYVEAKVAFQRTLDAPKGPILSDITIEGRQANSPPTARCQNVAACTDPGMCIVAGVVDINGGSFDPDHDPLTFGYSPPAPYALGPTQVNMSVSDGHSSDSCSASVMVTDCEAPALECPAPAAVECSSGEGCQQVTPALAQATDNCSIADTVQAAAACFPLGTTVTHYSTVDGSGNPASCTSSVTVQDTRPPVVKSAGAGTLWPPNHRMVTIGLDQCGIVVADACRGGLQLGGASAAITCVSSDEAPDALGDGHTETDIVIVDATHVQVRQERSGRQDGRVYHIGFSVSDGDGNVTNGTCTVSIPHDQSPKGAAVDSGPAYSICR